MKTRDAMDLIVHKRFNYLFEIGWLLRAGKKLVFFMINIFNQSVISRNYVNPYIEGYTILAELFLEIDYVFYYT